jgi:hypothetical protein
MANNYLQFSTSLQLSSPEEVAYWNDALTIIPSLFQNHNLGEDTPEKRQKLLDQISVQFGIDLSEDLFDDYLPGFDVEISSENSDEHGIWFYAEENGSLEFLGTIVQAYFKKFRPDGFFSCSYAETCSKMREDEFSGGAIVVTADEIKYHHVSDFIRREEKMHNNRVSNKAFLNKLSE